MILPAQRIRQLCQGERPLVSPFSERTVSHGMTYGLSAAGYDVRIREEVQIRSGSFVLASTVERFNMPDNLIGRLTNKSSWARLGVSVHHSVIEPGWRGYLTLEIFCVRHELESRGFGALTIGAEAPIAQVVFEELSEPTDQPYTGKYQDQPAGPQSVVWESQ